MIYTHIPIRENILAECNFKNPGFMYSPGARFDIKFCHGDCDYFIVQWKCATSENEDVCRPDMDKISR